MSRPVIASLDELLGPDREPAWPQPIPGLGLVVQPGLTVLAGACSIGKTSLALKITTELVSCSSSCQALLVPFADGPEEFARRLSRYRPVFDGSPDATARVWIDNGLWLCTDEIADHARQWASMHASACKLIVVDDLQHLLAVEQKAVSGAGVAAAFRELAIELEATIILCARLPSRGRRASWVPARSELLAYGPILKHCDATIMIYRDAYYHRETTSPGEAELLLWPPQHGRSLVTLSWDTPSGTFGPPIHA